MSATYNRFLKLLEKWPVNTTRSGRELREHIRKELDASLRANTNPEVNEAYLNKQYDALNRILNNVYGNKYKRCNYTETASGLTLELCQFATSKENIDNKRD